MEESMTARDAYVRKLKEQLGRWNAEIAKLDVKAKQPLASVKDAYEKQLKDLRGRRNAMHPESRRPRVGPSERGCGHGLEGDGGERQESLVGLQVSSWRGAAISLVTTQYCKATLRLAGHI
jgi:hypothetical protein